MKDPTEMECFGILDTCAVFECAYTDEEFRAMRDEGYTGVIFGYLDANWDGRFSRLDNYARSSVFPDLIPEEEIAANRAELERRLDCAKRAGLKVWMSVRGPLTETDLRASSPELAEKYQAFFGPGGDKWGGSGMHPFCLSFPEVRQRYRELIRDAVRSFPEINGFTFFGGDSYSLVCDSTCPRCGKVPGWKRWSDWVAELKREADAIRPGAEFTIMNWPWWDDMFEMAQDAPEEIGFVLTSSWGVSYEGDGLWPAAIEPWECQEFQEDTLRVPVNHAHRTAYELTQPWINAPVSEKYRSLARICRAQGRKFYAWSDITTSEAVLPYFTPYPATALDRLRNYRDCGAAGIVDFWGIPSKRLRGEHQDANALLLERFLDSPDLSGDELLHETARTIYGEENAADAVEAWKEIDEGLSRWPIIGYSQRMHWTCRRLWETGARLFYVFDLTSPYLSPDDRLDSAWPEFLRHPEVWERLKIYLERTLACYERALACCERICLRSGGKAWENAAFHRDCVTLTACFFRIAWESCDYHIAGLTGKKLSAEYLRQVAVTRRLARTLNDKLNTTPHENDMSEALSRMSEV